MAQAASEAVKKDVNDASDAQQDARLLQSLSESLRQYTPPEMPVADNLLAGRFQIEMSQPLPEYDAKNARAYAVTDVQESGRRYFAHVCDPGTYQRHNVLTLLKVNRHPNVLPIMGSGTISLSALGAQRHVIVYERPIGRTIAELLANTQGPLNEAFIRERIVGPLVSAVQFLTDLEITHGSINANNVYYGDVVMLGPCVAEPCGYSQPFYFETLERMMAMQAAKGDGSALVDYHALSVLIVYLLFGAKHFAHYTQETMIAAILKEGQYNAILRQRDHPVSYFDFFRAMLAPTTDERSARYMKFWIDGKRYNVLTTIPPNDALRPYEVEPVFASNRRELAYIFGQNWNLITDPLLSGALTHWVTTSLRNKEQAEVMGKISRSAREISNKKDVQMTEQLMRVVTLLDPMAPIRVGTLALFIDGVDSLCVELFAKQSQQEILMLTKIIELNMAGFWIESQRKDAILPRLTNPTMARLEKLRSYIRNTSPGFGAERMLYDLNPDMPCLSPLLDKYYVTNLVVLLKTLDMIAPRVAKEQEPVDRHIAAFIASKLSIQYEVRLNELMEIPELAGHRTFLSLKLLYLAQQKTGSVLLPGLTHWLAIRVMPALDSIRGRTLRKGMKELLLRQAQSGQLGQMVNMLLSDSYAAHDYKGFAMAANAYRQNAASISGYNHHEHIGEHSRKIAYMIARSCAYLALLISLFLSLNGD